MKGRKWCLLAYGNHTWLLWIHFVGKLSSSEMIRQNFGFRLRLSPRTETSDNVDSRMPCMYTCTHTCVHPYIPWNSWDTDAGISVRSLRPSGKDSGKGPKETNFQQNPCNSMRHWIPIEKKHNSEVVVNLSSLIIMRIPWAYMDTELSLAFVNKRECKFHKSEDNLKNNSDFTQFFCEI